MALEMPATTIRAQPTRPALPPCVFFKPTADELIGYYLTRRIKAHPTNSNGVIYEADVYGTDPDQLTRQFDPSNAFGEWYFFSQCKRLSSGGQNMSRRGKLGGAWMLQQGKKTVYSSNVEIGYSRKFRYKKAGSDSLSLWLMEEYGCYDKGTTAGDAVDVICRIYVTPRSGSEEKSSPVQQATELSFEDEQPEVKRLRKSEPAGVVIAPPHANLPGLPVNLPETTKPLPRIDEANNADDETKDDDEFVRYLDGILDVAEEPRISTGPEDSEKLAPSATSQSQEQAASWDEILDLDDDIPLVPLEEIEEMVNFFI